MQHVSPAPHAHPPPSTATAQSTAVPPARPARAAGTWQAAMSADGQWALVYDAQGRNLAEMHRPAVPTGPLGRTLCFAQVVTLMCAGPDLYALLQESITPGGIGPHKFSRPGGYRDRVRALLDQLALPAAI